MAERRMFSKRFVNRDSFLELPLSAQALYFHLSIEADDDGFVESPKGIMRKIGAAAEDLKTLEENQFVITFSSGILVISHWRLHNQIRTDRYHATVFQKEYHELYLDESQIYQLRNNNYDSGNENQSATSCQPNDNQMETESMLVHDSLGKGSKQQAMNNPVSMDDPWLVVGNNKNENSEQKKQQAAVIAQRLINSGFEYTGHGKGGIEGFILRMLNNGHTQTEIIDANQNMQKSIKYGNQINDQTAYLASMLQ